MDTGDHFEDLDSPWSWLVLLATFTCLFVIGGTNYSVGLVHNVLQRRYGGLEASTSLVGAVHTSISNIAGETLRLTRQTYSLTL